MSEETTRARATRQPSITVTLTRKQHRLLVLALCERGSKVHPCDRYPETWAEVCDLLLTWPSEPSTCTAAEAADEQAATCSGGGQP